MTPLAYLSLHLYQVVLGQQQYLPVTHFDSINLDCAAYALDLGQSPGTTSPTLVKAAWARPQDHSLASLSDCEARAEKLAEG